MPGMVYDCVVLGAGIAGVTAARDLQRAGLHVLLLEGSARIGGRMFTKRAFARKPGVDPARYPLEAGAEYIHVSPMSDYYPEFFAELRRHGFTLGKFPKWGGPGMGDGHNRVFFRGFAQPKTLVDTMFTDCPDIWDMHGIIDDISDYTGANDIPVGRYVAQRNFTGRGVTMARYALSAHTPGILDGARDDISVQGLKADWIPDQLMEESERRLEAPAGGAIRIIGYDSLPRAIAEEFENPRQGRGVPGEIRLNAIVTRVERSGNGLSISVRGDPGPIVTRAAICTFSVGVLDPVNGEGDAIFGPLLTPRKRQALRVVRMGAITKFSLEFSRRVWPEEKMTVLSYPEGDARTFFSPFPSEPNGPFVLTGLIMGRDHELLKNLNDDQAWRHVFRVIEEILNPNHAAGAWDPAQVLVGSHVGGAFTPNFSRQDWEADPLFRGGNSYIAHVPGAGIAPAQARLALKDASETAPLFWAGEATAPAHRARYQPLCVHGAYISGVGAAEEVWRYLRPITPTVAPGLPRGARAMAARSSAARAPAKSRKPKKPAKSKLPTPSKEPAKKLSATVYGRELAALERYAKTYTKGNLNAAAEDLLRFTLKQNVIERLADSSDARPSKRAIKTKPPRKQGRSPTKAKSRTKRRG